MKKGLLIGVLTLLAGLFPAAGAFAQSYSGTTVASEPDGVTYKVVANSGDTVTLADVGSGTGQLAITFSANVNGSVVVRESTTRPSSASSDAPGATDRYYDVTLGGGITNANITSGKWRFTVAKEWLNSKDASSGNVFLHHFGSSWNRLNTKEISATSTSHNFEADVTDFSPFAISAVQGLSNTGSPYMLGAVIATSVLAVLGGTVFLSRKQRT